MQITSRFTIAVHIISCIDYFGSDEKRVTSEFLSLSTNVNPEHTLQVKDGADFPKMYLPLANAQGKELELLRKRNDVNWTFISPAGDFQAEGERTGKYILAGEELTLNSKGESIISYADYAVAMIDLIENGGHVKERVSVVRK